VFQVARATGAEPTIIPCLAKLSVPCSRHAAGSSVWLFLFSSVLSWCLSLSPRSRRSLLRQSDAGRDLSSTLLFLCLQRWYEYLCTPRVLVLLLLRTSDHILRHFHFSYICSHAWTQHSTINLYRSHSFQQRITFTCLNPAILLY
jgi:hypothetical protein